MSGLLVSNTPRWMNFGSFTSIKKLKQESDIIVRATFVQCIDHKVQGWAPLALHFRQGSDDNNSFHWLRESCQILFLCNATPSHIHCLNCGDVLAKW